MFFRQMILYVPNRAVLRHYVTIENIQMFFVTDYFLELLTDVERFAVKTNSEQGSL